MVVFTGAFVLEVCRKETFRNLVHAVSKLLCVLTKGHWSKSPFAILLEDALNVNKSHF